MHPTRRPRCLAPAVLLASTVLVPPVAFHASDAVAQPPDTLAAAVARHEDAPVLRAAPLTGSIRVDGHLDEPAWQTATPADHFTQREPKEGAPATERTEVRALIGEDALFLGARLYDREPWKIRKRLVRRDDDLASDFLAVLLDAYHDHSTAVIFRVNPAGSINDLTVAASGAQDASWDPVWHVHTVVDSLGWCAEIEIPLSQLHYNGAADATWGIQIRRWIDRKQEFSEFSFTPLKDDAGVGRYGHLTGLGALESVRHVELLPYGRVRSEQGPVEDGDPFRDGSEQFPAAGMDFKYGLTSNLTLNGTLNPDFGEVEVDPAVVNLSAFETFYPERRPFFVEGADVFRFGETRSFNNFNTTIPFHARRIGRPPQRDLDDEGDVVFFDSPARTTITAAAKLTGKTRNGWTLGLLDAVTPEERATYVDTTGVGREAPVEPLTNYFVGRFRRDYRHGNTVLGGMVTSSIRHLDDPTLDEILRSRAFVGGLDLNHYWAGRKYSLDAMVLGSTVRGSEASIGSTQQSSARYYQRPDADYVTYDPTRTSLTGYAGHLSLNKIAGKHWQGSLTYQDWSPGFEMNDLGFQNAADSRAVSTLAMYKENRPARLVRSWVSFVFSNWSWNYGGANTYEEYAAHLEGTWANYWFSSIRGEYYPGNSDDKLTRGGPLSRLPAGGTIRASLTTDSRKTYTLGLNGILAWDEAGGYLRSLNTSLSVRPTTAFRLLLEPGIRFFRDNAQYVQTESDPFATATYGARYVFGTIEQTQLNLDTRLDWTFSPKLSLQLYVQPLIVSGDYADLKELRMPSTYEFNVYGGHVGTTTPLPNGDSLIDPDGAGPAPSFTVANPDFNFRSLRANAVLRWEYRPGSALFFVWQQGREESASMGDFDLSRDWKALFDIEAENVFALKATYWLPI